MSPRKSHDDTVRRAALPEVLLASDLALATGLTEEEAQRAALAGRLGPFFLVRGGVAMLREDFLAALAKRARSAGGAEKDIVGGPRRLETAPDGQEGSGA